MNRIRNTHWGARSCITSKCRPGAINNAKEKTRKSDKLYLYLLFTGTESATILWRFRHLSSTVLGDVFLTRARPISPALPALSRDASYLLVKASRLFELLGSDWPTSRVSIPPVGRSWCAEGIGIDIPTTISGTTKLNHPKNSVLFSVTYAPLSN